MILNKNMVDSINVAGQGGAEKKFAPVLEVLGYQNVNQPLWDFEHSKTGSKIELKKQSGVQWFDIGKYYDLTSDQRDIIMMFVIHKTGAIQTIHTISLGEFLDLVCNDPEFARHGWTDENIARCYEMKKLFPTMQVKVSLHIGKLIRKHNERFKNIFNS